MWASISFVTYKAVRPSESEIDQKIANLSNGHRFSCKGINKKKESGKDDVPYLHRVE